MWRQGRGRFFFKEKKEQLVQVICRLLRSCLGRSYVGLPRLAKSMVGDKKKKAIKAQTLMMGN
jgi:hypothetical protein